MCYFSSTTDAEDRPPSIATPHILTRPSPFYTARQLTNSYTFHCLCQRLRHLAFFMNTACRVTLFHHRFKQNDQDYNIRQTLGRPESINKLMALKYRVFRCKDAERRYNIVYYLYWTVDVYKVCSLRTYVLAGVLFQEKGIRQAYIYFWQPDRLCSSNNIGNINYYQVKYFIGNTLYVDYKLIETNPPV